MKLFISHASEDKDAFVRPLAERLQTSGIDVWYDEFVLALGDSLRESIERGIAECDYGVVVLSESFFQKKWPTQELNGLFSRDLASTRTFLIPVLHAMDTDRLRELAPMLADRVMLLSKDGEEKVAKHIMSVLVGDEEQRRIEGAVVARHRYDHRYYNPAGDIPKFGYKLASAGFAAMVAQLRAREILLAHGRPYHSYACAAHVTDEERMLEITRDWCETPTYYAVDVMKLKGEFDKPIPKDELRALVYPE